MVRKGGVHSTIGLMAPAVLLFVWLNRARWQGVWSAAILGAAAGLLAYVLIFAAIDQHAPPANIFNTVYASARSSRGLSQADLDNPLQRMLFLGSATQWREAMFADRGNLSARLLDYAHNLPRELAWPTLLLAATGLVLMVWRESSLACLFLSALLLQWGFSLTYQISDYAVFYIAGYLLLALLAGYGAAGLAAGLARLPWAGGRQAAAVALLAIMALGIWPQIALYLPALRAGQVAFLGDPGYMADAETEPAYREATRVVA